MLTFHILLKRDKYLLKLLYLSETTFCVASLCCTSYYYKMDTFSYLCILLRKVCTIYEAQRLLRVSKHVLQNLS